MWITSISDPPNSYKADLSLFLQYAGFFHHRIDTSPIAFKQLFGSEDYELAHTVFSYMICVFVDTPVNSWLFINIPFNTLEFLYSSGIDINIRLILVPPSSIINHLKHTQKLELEAWYYNQYGNATNLSKQLKIYESYASLIYYRESCTDDYKSTDIPYPIYCEWNRQIYFRTLSVDWLERNCKDFRIIQADTRHKITGYFESYEKAVDIYKQLSRGENSLKKSQIVMKFILETYEISKVDVYPARDIWELVKSKFPESLGDLQEILSINNIYRTRIDGEYYYGLAPRATDLTQVFNKLYEITGNINDTIDIVIFMESIHKYIRFPSKNIGDAIMEDFIRDMGLRVVVEDLCGLRVRN